MELQGLASHLHYLEGQVKKVCYKVLLSEIRGKPKISFRVYELYCMGVQYPFYWQSRE